MLGKIRGMSLHLAKMKIANYCLTVANQAAIDVNALPIVSQLNEEFALVPPSELHDMVADIQNFCDCIVAQRTNAFDRMAYWNWQAFSALNAKTALIADLRALQI